MYRMYDIVQANCFITFVDICSSNIKLNKMEEDKNLQEKLDNSNEELHISDVINRREQLILFSQFVQNDYYGNGIEHAENIVDRWLNREKN